METKQFKTNIKCSGCVEKVTPGLNETAGANNWSVDLQSPERILTISGDKINTEEIGRALEKAGYRAEELV